MAERTEPWHLLRVATWRIKADKIILMEGRVELFHQARLINLQMRSFNELAQSFGTCEAGYCIAVHFRKLCFATKQKFCCGNVALPPPPSTLPGCRKICLK